MPADHASSHPTGGASASFCRCPGRTYDYRVPPGLTLAAGDFVRVPLGRARGRVAWGAADGDVADERLRDVGGRLSHRRCPMFRAASPTGGPPIPGHAGRVLEEVVPVPDALNRRAP
jgi:hypothetical protein